MKDEVIRVLHITEMLSAAGIESFIMNMYHNIDRSKIQFDFLVLRDQHEFYDDEIKLLGGKKYFVCSGIKNTWLRILDESQKIESFLKKHSYQIVHIHYTTPLRAPYLLAAMRAGVKVRIYHAHSAEVSGKSKIKLCIYNYYRKKITQWGTEWYACSKLAADWIFEKSLVDSNKIKIVYNGIDSNRFKYSLEIRKKVRTQLNIKDEYVIINTGRFIEQKNQQFILDIFSALKKQCSKAKLVLLGEGKLMDETINKAKRLNIRDDVYFLGVKSNVNEYLCAADCYVMPSLYEGLPVAAVEAQCAGLPCVMSKNITKEVKLIDSAIFLSLEDSAELWAKKIIGFQNYNRKDESKTIVEKGYDVKQVALWLESRYIDMAMRGER